MRVTTNPLLRPLNRTARAVLAVAVAALLLAACGDDTATTSASVGPATAGKDRVDIEASRYSPQELQVPAGDTVTFVNHDPFDHTVTAKGGDPATFDSGDLGQDATFSVTFDEPGTYRYFCRIHPTMRATVVVEG